VITYRNLAESDLIKMTEIDRSEIVRVGYEVREGALVEKDVMWDSPNFIPVGEGEHTVAGEIEFCRGHMARNAIAIGGFDGETLTAIGSSRQISDPVWLSLPICMLAGPTGERALGLP